ncbi:MAG: NADP-specific glutamate dehydrogenase [Bacillota bacterium]|nr:NADP-specific glutamate dehydrogenase [Bacillota bacterium]
MTLNHFLNRVAARNPHQPEFLQAVSELAASVWPVYESRDDLVRNQILDLIVEPERQVIFRVTWVDDEGEVQVNRGCRIQYNSALGPYKGGMRFHPSVNQANLKTLGFEQIFKNSLTGLAMGSGTGGADFDPKGRSDGEVMRFCKSLMMELYRHIGANIDVPARDLGVGEREIGYMFGAYNRIKNDYTGAFTGRSVGLGGSPLRAEAAGYGCVYFVEEMLKTIGESLEGKTVALSGYGNVAQYAIEKINQLGGMVVTVSDSTGFVHDPAGISGEKWQYLLELKGKRYGQISDYAKLFEAAYHPGQKPWAVPCQVAIPCATLHELDEADARALVKNGCRCIGEGANMAATPAAVEMFRNSPVLFAPGKAAGAGAVAVSGFEMSQTSQRLSWEAEEVDRKLKNTMRSIHEQCMEHGKNGGRIDYVKGANVAGFLRVANAMVSRGLL